MQPFDQTKFSPKQNALHITIATVILLSFWSMLAYSFRAELLPPALWLVQTIAGLGGDVVESRYFQVINNAGANRSKVNSVISILETDYRLILNQLDLEAGDPIQVLISPGASPPFANGNQLILFFDGYSINLDTAPVFLTMLMRGKGLDSNNLFLEAGFALYTTEEIERAKGLGQSSEAWVLLLQQQGGLLPFDQAWQVTLPTDEAGLYDLIRAIVQGGAFTRWVSDTYGPEAVQALLSGQRLETVTGLYFDEAEQRWLETLTSKEISPQRCQTASLGKPWLQPLCERLDR
ncbi:MAG: hypothetical protein AAF629_04065 [Chloroflexota bacterium]